MNSKRTRDFRRDVWNYWKREGRHSLPWRKTTDPYKILVSEVMLQQTQVLRVIPKYKAFLKRFPTARALARAQLSAVLKEWSGLGYNRRGKYLHDAVKKIVAEFRGDFRQALEHSLPGVGPYTRSAVRVFAFNEPDVLLETNVRTAIIHYFFSRRRLVHDNDVTKIAEMAAKGQNPRTWQSALFDYGSHLKKLHQNPTRKSAHYVVQSKFEGSSREVRGAILKLLNDGAHGDRALAQKLEFDEYRVREALRSLNKDGLVSVHRGSWKIA